MSKDFQWSDVYLHWSLLAMEMRWDPKVSFTPILVNSPGGGLRIGTEICDWWPTEKIAERRAQLEKHGSFGVHWVTKKGTLHTAQLLYECHDNEESQAAILLAASMRDKLKCLPEAWRGEIRRLITSFNHVIFRDPQSPICKLKILNWHHAMRDTLPTNLATEDFAMFSKPHRYEDLIHIALLETVLSMSAWTPVVVSHIEPALENEPVT